MNLSISFLLFLLIKSIFYCISLVDYNDNKFNRFIYNYNLSKEESYNVSYDVALTTIPPRFHHIHHTIISWLHQIIKPNKIFIFIPLIYKRFRKVIKIKKKKKKNHDNCMNKNSCYVKDDNNYSSSGNDNNTTNNNMLSMKQQLYDILLQNINLTDYLLNHTINFIQYGIVQRNG